MRQSAQASRRSLANASSAARLVEAGDIAGFESLVSQLSPNKRGSVFSPTKAVGAAEDELSPLMIAVRRGSMPLILVVLKWVPEDQVG